MNLILSLTEQCNLRCTYCYYKESHKERIAVMNDDVLEASLRLSLDRTIELRQSFLNITFFGGEPLLRLESIHKGTNYIKKLVKKRRSELPKDFELKFAINTNGTLLTEDILNFLEQEKFEIFLSLDGTAKRHNTNRKKINGRGCFNKIKPHLFRLAKMNTTILSVVTQENHVGLANSINWLIKQGFTKIQTSVDFNKKWTGSELDELALEYKKMAKIWIKLQNENSPIYIGTIQDKISLSLLNISEKEHSCNIFKTGIGIATNGNAFPCSRFITSNPNAPYMLGNVLDSKQKIFSGSVAKEITSFLKKDKEKCKGCAIAHRCDAHECGCTSFYTTGSIHGISPEVCTHERILCAICDETLEEYTHST